MEKTKSRLSGGEFVSVASMLFGLFFGAGNLIFPVYMGQMAGRHLAGALAGFLITGVGLPLLAVISLGITGSSGVFDMSSRFGRKFGRIFTCALYLTIGPFFACPRCITVPFETGIRQILPSGVSPKLGLFLFALVFYVLLLWFSLRPGKILTYVGKVLNPIFIVVLAVMIIAALTHASGKPFAPSGAYRTGAFAAGFLNGYNTMDALAGLAFGIVIINVLRDLGIRDTKSIASNTVRTGIVSCSMMGVIYILAAIMGMESLAYAPMRDNGGTILADVASHYFPYGGSLLLAAIVFLACLKTVIGLVTSCATSFVELIPGKISYRAWTVLFCTITFVIANIGLESIIKISVPVLSMLYPIAIVLILLSLLKSAVSIGKATGKTVMTVVCISSVFDLIRTLPASWTAAAHLNVILDALNAYLPFFKSGFGWAVPSAVAFAAAQIVSAVRKKHTR